MSYLKQRLQAEAQAKALAKRLRVIGRPVDVNQIAEDLKISIQVIPLDDELSGMAFTKAGSKFIIVNAAHHLNRRRFTICHEIAHHVLHADELSGRVHVDKTVFARNARSITGEDLFEVEANAFAAELLMPRSELRKIGQIDVNDDARVALLAREFRVSAAAMAVRIENLVHREYETLT